MVEGVLKRRHLRHLRLCQLNCSMKMHRWCSMQCLCILGLPNGSTDFGKPKTDNSWG